MRGGYGRLTTIGQQFVLAIGCHFDTSPSFCPLIGSRLTQVIVAMRRQVKRLFESGVPTTEHLRFYYPILSLGEDSFDDYLDEVLSS